MVYYLIYYMIYFLTKRPIKNAGFFYLLSSKKFFIKKMPKIFCTTQTFFDAQKLSKYLVNT